MVALTVLVGESLCLARGVFSAPAPGTLESRVGVVAMSPVVVTMPLRKSANLQRAAAARTATGTASAQHAASSRPSADQGGTAAAQVLALINRTRAGAGLPPLTITSGHVACAAAHNLRMADGGGLSHQCPGEPPLSARATAAGIIWTAVGENVGQGGPVGDTDAAIAEMVVSLTQAMINERPPDDGHRLNIMSSKFTRIGIAVYRDGSGTVWLTQDFSS